MEEWREIEGFEGIYQVSNLGRVKSLGNDKSKKEKILKPCIHIKGYYCVNLYKNKKLKRFTVHRLVAVAFIPNDDDKPCVNHISGIKTQNNVENLEWLSYSQNNQHAYKNGLKKSKLTEKEVLEIRNSNLTQRELAKRYNVGESLISHIKNKKRWKHI